MEHTSDKIGKLLADESFQRWLSGEGTEDDRKFWENWLNQTDQNRLLYQQAVRLWEATRFWADQPSDIEEKVLQLQQRLGLEPVGLPDTALPDTHAGCVPAAVSRHRWQKALLGIAASLVLAIVFWFYFLPDHTLVVKTEYGQRNRIDLPDGSKIILNANSELRYPRVWNTDTPRHIELKGEAYFQVTPRPAGAQRDFVVQTKDGEIRVVGTRFVVYDRGNGSVVTLEEGALEITPHSIASRRSKPTSITLSPGESLTFQRGDLHLKPKQEILPLNTSWWQDYIVLQKTPCIELLKRLQDTYGIKFVVKDPALLQRTISGSIENKGPEVIIKTIAEALQVSYRFEDNEVIFYNERQ